MVTWMDKKLVHVAGTVTGTPTENVSFVKRRMKDGMQEDVPCPEIIKKCSRFMGVSIEMTRSNHIIL